MNYKCRYLLGLVLIIVTVGTSGCGSVCEQQCAQEYKKKDLESKMVARAPQGISLGAPECETNTVSSTAQPNSEEYGRIVESDFLSVKQNPFSTFSIDVDTASYANVRRFLNDGQLPPSDAVRTEEMVNYFPYEYPQPTKEPFSISVEVADCPWAPGHKLAHLGLKGRDISENKLPPNNLVFLLDVSGSMDEEAKLPLLKKSFAMLVEKLRPQDRVSIVTYAGSSGLVLPPTPGNQKSTILAALDRLEAGGATAGGEGINLAYDTAMKTFIKNGNNRVVLATDGDFNVGMSSDSELERLIEEKRKSGIFLTVLGFGMGNIKDSHMETLADIGNGNHAYIDSLQEARKVLVHEFGGTMFTIAKDVKLQVEFNPMLVKGYRLIGYENRILAAEDFNDDKKDAGELGSGHRVTALYEIIPAGAQERVRDDVDPSRYQKLFWVSGAPTKDELMCVKLRYKDPSGSESKKLSYVVANPDSHKLTTSNNFRWSAAVAEFSLVLRDSKYKGASSYGEILKLANSAASSDKAGYRAEFIDLVKRAQTLDNRTQASIGTATSIGNANSIEDASSKGSAKSL